MKSIINNRGYYILISIIVILLDQLTKYIIDRNYYSIINKNILLFTFKYIKNYGAAFNLLNGNRLLLSTLSVFISLILIYYILRKKDLNSIDLLGYSFILGGTIGNGFDRIIKGYVVDFINLNFINFPVFNIADISINIGFILILYGLIKNNN